MKNRNIIMIILSIFVVIGMIFDGIMIYDRYFKADKKASNIVDENKPNDETVDDKTNSEEKENIEEEKKIDKEDAKRLVDEYFSYSSMPVFLFFQEKLTEELKMHMAIKKVKEESSTLSKYLCSDLYDGKIDSDGTYEIEVEGELVGFCYSHLPLTGIDYKSANEAYKYLFGQVEVLPKKDFVYIDYFDYIEQIDEFIPLDTQWGYSALIEVYGVKDFTLNGNILTIKVGYAKFGTSIVNGNIVPNFNENLSFTYEETLEENFGQTLVDKYGEQMDTTELIFEWENDHYILKSIN